MTNTFWQPKNKLSIWAIHNDDGDLGEKRHFISEPYGLPRELQPTDKFYTEEEERKEKRKK